MIFVEKLSFYKIHVSDSILFARTYFSRGRENTIFLFDPFLIFMIFSILKIATFQTFYVENTTFRYFSNQKYFKIVQFLCQFFENYFRYFSNVNYILCVGFCGYFLDKFWAIKIMSETRIL